MHIHQSTEPKPIKITQEAVRQSVLDSLPQIVEEVLLRQRKKLAHKVSTWVGRWVRLEGRGWEILIYW
jgi:hypothetical protein